MSLGAGGYTYPKCPPPMKIDLATKDCGGCESCPTKLWHRCHTTGIMLACLIGHEEDPLGMLAAPARTKRVQPKGAV